ncbi:60S ribosomal protein L23a-like [Trichosurus vulpecula]|uniref:60S ribosomal protein L23a-like n=1 Tax=Trichosurus vulpecula TaxID=9337 RepID=UPI00186B19AB|nr:60S ribosomal protein L23a-like [Trichosurus vulpecula]
MALKAKKEAVVSLKAEAKSKDLKAKKAVLKGVHSHKEDLNIPHLSATQHTKTPKASQIPSEKCPSEKQAGSLCHIKFLLTTESSLKKTEDNTLVFIVYVKANKHQIKQVPPRFELGSLDSESRVLTITPWNRRTAIDAQGSLIVS